MPEFSECRVDEVCIDDLIDLEDDEFADPEDRRHIFPYEMARVIGFEQETDNCIRVDFDSTSIGFPPDHLLRRYDGE